MPLPQEVAERGQGPCPYPPARWKWSQAARRGVCLPVQTEQDRTSRAAERAQHCCVSACTLGTRTAPKAWGDEQQPRAVGWMSAASPGEAGM